MRGAPRATIGIAMCVLLGLAGGCTKGAVDDAVARSTAPLLVPMGTWRDAFEFTAPPGSTDLYQLQWNFRPGRTDLVTGWQVASTTTYDETAMTEGPGQAVVDEALRAARGEGCTVPDRAAGIQLCVYDAEFALGGVNAYLVRLVDNHILVVDYSNLDGERTIYNPDSLEARFINADFESVPIEQAADDYLVYIY